MKNMFKGTCYRCGKEVPAEAGIFTYENSPAHRWPRKGNRYQRNWPMVEHVECAEKYEGTNVHYIYEPDHENSE